jgi:hypothetical protein
MTTQVDTVVLAGRWFDQDPRALAQPSRNGFLYGDVDQVGVDDLIACEGNPLEDITCLPHPSYVMKGGRVAVDRLVTTSTGRR